MSETTEYPNKSEEKTAGEVYKKASASVVHVLTGSGRGSGVVIGDNEVVTNCHVVDGGGPIRVFQPPRNGTDSPKESAAKVVAASMRDLCLLKTEGLSIPAADIGEANSVGYGSSVYAVGCPCDIYAVLSSGIVSQFRPAHEGDDEPTMRDIQTTAAISRGSSGGGLFDREGRLIGITCSSEPFSESIHFALPAGLVGYLRQRAQAEGRLRENLSQILINPPSDLGALFDMAAEMSDAMPVLARQIAAWSSSGEIAALSGSRGLAFAKKSAERLTMLSESEERKEDRDMALGGAANVAACMGEIDRALQFCEKIESEGMKNNTIMFIAQMQARIDIREGNSGARANDIFNLATLRKDAEDPTLLLMTACARAEMRYYGSAMDLAGALLGKGRIRYPNESLRDRFFVVAVAEIAAILHRQGTFVGARALFDHAIRHSQETDPRFLAEVAFCAANAGDIKTAQLALREKGELRASGRIPREEGPDYEDEVEQYGRMAETLALLGHPGCFDEMRRILVWDFHLPAALVRAAIGPSSS